MFHFSKLGILLLPLILQVCHSDFVVLSLDSLKFFLEFFRLSAICSASLGLQTDTAHHVILYVYHALALARFFNKLFAPHHV